MGAPPELSKRDRSLITVAALVASGNTEQLNFHLDYARTNGATKQELVEAITHFAFYAGWPKAMSAMTVAKKLFTADPAQATSAVVGLVRRGAASGMLKPKAGRLREPSCLWVRACPTSGQAVQVT